MARDLEAAWDCYAGKKGDRTFAISPTLYVKAKDKAEAEQLVTAIVKRLKYGGGYHFHIEEIKR